MVEEHVGKKRRKEVRQAITMSEELRKTLLLCIGLIVFGIVVLLVLFVISYLGLFEIPLVVTNTVPLVILVVLMIFVAPKANRYWALRDEYNFEYGKDKIVDGISVNEKCSSLARKIKEIIDAKSSFADWLNNQNVRDQLKFDIKVCLIKNGYPPQYSPEVFRKVMEQVENIEEHSSISGM